MNIIKSVKKKVFLFLLASLPLVGVPFLSTKVEGKIEEVGAAATYIDVASGLTSLMKDSYYLFGAYAEENGSPYMYFMSYPGYGSFARVPCLSKSDGSHPCGISESDFASSCLNSLLLAASYSSSDLCFAFTSHLSALYADPNESYAFTGSTSANVTPTITFDTAASPETCTLSNWEYQIANEMATFKGYATSVDSGYSDALYAYPISPSLFYSLTAVGFATALKAGLYTSAEATSVFQGLSYAERNLFAYYMNTYRTSSVATQAVEKILIAGVSAYQTLIGSTSGIFHSKAPSYSVDYEKDEITGLSTDETYTLAINGTNVCQVRSSASFPFSGTMDNTPYDCTGNTISLQVYWPSSGGGGDTSSEAVSAAVGARLAAPSVAATLLSAKLTPSETTTALYEDSLALTPESGILYAIALSSNTMYSSSLEYLTWEATPSFTGLTPETSYTVYKRVHSTTASDSLPSYDATNGVYLGVEFTTLSELEGQKKKALVADYQSYQDKLAHLGANEGANLLTMLTALKGKIEAATSLSDLAALSGDSYRDAAFTFAAAQDQACLTLTSTLNLTSSDSTASQTAYQQALASIAALDFFSGNQSLSPQTYVDQCLVLVSSFRYRESQGQKLVAFFNDSIGPTLPKLSAAKQEQLWSAFDQAFSQMMTTLGTDLAETKSKVDALYSSACSSLSSLLTELSA